MAEVLISGISKVYENGFEAVKSADLQIHDGEFMVLVGPSGCGKSTLLRMVAGLEDITEGELQIAGQRMNEVAPKERDIAMVFQNYALYPHMTVAENMAFGLRLRKFPDAEIKQRVNEAAAILGLETMLERKPKELSGGQRQRVAVGRAIVRKPKVFLFDEPLSNLDAKLRVQMRLEISRLHQRLGATMIYVTHDQTEAMTMGDRITVLKDGIVQQVDSPLNLYNYPRNRFVAGFIGSPAMNFIKVQVDLSGELPMAVAESDSFPLPSALANGLKEFSGRELVLGVRPEHLFPAATGIATTIDVVEPVGNEAFIYFTIVGETLCARQSADNADLQVGTRVTFGLQADKLYFYDPGTEELVFSLAAEPQN
jgi:multiple sugar transport system ATP-binding protein